jgi:adenine-specific DNA methylase
MFALFGDENYMTQLTPFALKDAPALIEAVFPAQKVSFEAQKERKANLGQTLTGLGSYWKGRKPLILVRSVVLGSLLPQTDNTEKDLEIFELLMAFDAQSLAKRALIQNLIKPKDIAEKINLHNPWDYFSHNIKIDDERFTEIDALTLPLNPDSLGLKLRWRRDIEEKDKLTLLALFLDQIEGYEEKSLLCKRPEEVEQDWLYKHIWPTINKHYAGYGVNANSHQELIEQLGILKYGRRPKVADTFSGGGSIPFEAARLGCDVNASDLNPIACMLSWGALKLLSSEKKEQERLLNLYEEICKNVDDEIIAMGVECDEEGNRAKSFLYCLEVKCPETGWMIPLAPSWVISKTHNVIARLTPNYKTKTFDIDIDSGVSEQEMKLAENGTVSKGSMVYELDGKSYRTAIKTLRGDYKGEDGSTESQLRKWDKLDFHPHSDDLFQERLYAIQWYSASSLNSNRQEAFFRKVLKDDIRREEKARNLVADNILSWQAEGFLPDMEIEAGYNTSQPVRERGWKYWHQLFNSRQLLIFAIARKHIVKSREPSLLLGFCSSLNKSTKLSRWDSANRGREGVKDVFSNQALNTLYNYGARGFLALKGFMFFDPSYVDVTGESKIFNHPAERVINENDIWVTDPPYADAVNYHEITEFFIAWLRKSPPKPFDEWTWDSRRALAIKGSGDDFRKGMVNAYKAMADHMPDNGMQCVMFTHQDTGVWSDMIGIFWAAGLQVVGAWYIATETSTELKKGGYVQGTVILMLRKRPAGEKSGFRHRLLPAVRAEVKHQIETMMHLNDEIKDKMGEPVFNDSDLQMAGYAAALKVLTAYTHIGGEDVTAFALKPRTKGEVTVVDEIVQQAAEAANSILVPEGLTKDTWQKLSGIQRFYLRMMDIETTGAAKLDNYQNFAKAFRVDDYSRVMGSMAANKAQLKRIPEFASRDLTESNEIGSTWLGHLIIGLQQLLAEVDPQVVISQFQADLPDFMEIRVLLLDVLTFIENKAPEKATRDAAEVLGARLRNMRAIGN